MDIAVIEYKTRVEGDLVRLWLAASSVPAVSLEVPFSSVLGPKCEVYGQVALCLVDRNDVVNANG